MLSHEHVSVQGFRRGRGLVAISFFVIVFGPFALGNELQQGHWRPHFEARPEATRLLLVSPKYGVTEEVLRGCDRQRLPRRFGLHGNLDVISGGVVRDEEECRGVGLHGNVAFRIAAPRDF